MVIGSVRIAATYTCASKICYLRAKTHGLGIPNLDWQATTPRSPSSDYAETAE